ncbi:unnamed protein product [Boreogadus saida]
MAKRAAYFNEMELQVLLESYDEEKDIITRKGNAKASATRRTKAWQRIADRALRRGASMSILLGAPKFLETALHGGVPGEYLKMMMLAAEVCAKNDDENLVVLSAFSAGRTQKEFIEQRAASEVGNSATQGRYPSSWLIANWLEDRDKEPGAMHPTSRVWVTRRGEKRGL